MPDSPPSLDLERSGADTLCSPPPAVAAAREACLVHIYPTGPSMGKRYPLSMISSLLIGRASDCAILIDDNSVSRKHARIDPTPDGYHASDLGSTNGTFVNPGSFSQSAASRLVLEKSRSTTCSATGRKAESD